MDADCTACRSVFALTASETMSHRAVLSDTSTTAVSFMDGNVSGGDRFVSVESRSLAAD